jgi:peptidoglycan/LPS O-acetylase OafA/YrhL
MQISVETIVYIIVSVLAPLLEYLPRLGEEFEQMRPHVKRIVVILAVAAVTVGAFATGPGMPQSLDQLAEAFRVFLTAAAVNQSAHRLTKRTYPMS